MMSVERPIGARRRSAEVTSFLTWKGTPSSSRRELLGRLPLELLELLDDRQHLPAQRLERRRHAEADVGQAHVAQALLAEGRAGAVADQLVSEAHARRCAARRSSWRARARCRGAERSRFSKYSRAVGAHARDVDVEPGLPAAVAGAPAELDEQLARRWARPPPPRAAARASLRRRRPRGRRASRRGRSRAARSGGRSAWSRAWRAMKVPPRRTLLQARVLRRPAERRLPTALTRRQRARLAASAARDGDGQRPQDPGQRPGRRAGRGRTAAGARSRRRSSPRRTTSATSDDLEVRARRSRRPRRSRRRSPGAPSRGRDAPAGRLAHPDRRDDPQVVAERDHRADDDHRRRARCSRRRRAPGSGRSCR